MWNVRGGCTAEHGATDSGPRDYRSEDLREMEKLMQSSFWDLV